MSHINTKFGIVTERNRISLLAVGSERAERAIL